MEDRTHRIERESNKIMVSKYNEKLNQSLASQESVLNDECNDSISTTGIGKRGRKSNWRGWQKRGRGGSNHHTEKDGEKIKTSQYNEVRQQCWASQESVMSKEEDECNNSVSSNSTGFGKRGGKSDWRGWQKRGRGGSNHHTEKDGEKIKTSQYNEVRQQCWASQESVMSKEEDECNNSVSSNSTGFGKRGGKSDWRGWQKRGRGGSNHHTEKDGEKIKTSQYNEERQQSWASQESVMSKEEDECNNSVSSNSTGFGKRGGKSDWRGWQKRGRGGSNHHTEKDGEKIKTSQYNEERQQSWASQESVMSKEEDECNNSVSSNSTGFGKRGGKSNWRGWQKRGRGGSNHHTEKDGEKIKTSQYNEERQQSWASQESVMSKEEDECNNSVSSNSTGFGKRGGKSDWRGWQKRGRGGSNHHTEKDGEKIKTSQYNEERQQSWASQESVMSKEEDECNNSVSSNSTGFGKRGGKSNWRGWQKRGRGGSNHHTEKDGEKIKTSQYNEVRQQCWASQESVMSKEEDECNNSVSSNSTGFGKRGGKSDWRGWQKRGRGGSNHHTEKDGEKIKTSQYNEVRQQCWASQESVMSKEEDECNNSVSSNSTGFGKRGGKSDWRGWQKRGRGGSNHHTEKDGEKIKTSQYNEERQQSWASQESVMSKEEDECNNSVSSNSTGLGKRGGKSDWRGWQKRGRGGSNHHTEKDGEKIKTSQYNEERQQSWASQESVMSKEEDECNNSVSSNSTGFGKRGGKSDWRGWQKRGRGGSNHHTEKDGEKIKTSQYNEVRQQCWASQESVMSKEEDECNNSVSSNSTGFGKRGGKSDWRGWQKRGRGGSNHHTEKDGEKIKTSQYNEERQQSWASQESVMSKEEDECNNSVSSNSTGFGKRGGKSDWRGWQKRGRGGSNHHTEKDGEKIKTSQYNEERQQSWASQESVMSKEEDECNNSVSSNSTGFGKRGGKSDWRGWQKRGRGGSNHHTEKDGEKIKTSQYNEERQQSWASQESVMSKEEDECNNSVSSNSTGFGKRGGKSDWRGWQKRGRGGSNHHTEKDGEKIKTSQYNEVRQQCWASQESVMSKEEDECNNSVSSNSTGFGKRGGKSDWRGWQKRGRGGSNHHTEKDGEKIKTSQYNEVRQQCWASQESVMSKEEDECNNSVSSNSTGFGKRGGKSDWRGWQKRGRGGSNHHTEKDGEKIKTSQYNEERQQSWASQESVMSKEEDECNNSVSSNSTGFGKRGGKSDWRGWQKRGRGGSNHHTEKDGEKIKTSQYNEVRQQCWASQESVMSKEEDECNNSVSSNSTGFGKRGGKSDWRGWQKRGRGDSNHHTEKDGEKIKTSQYNEVRQQCWASQESVMSKEEDECNNSVSSNSTGFGKRGGKSDWRGWQKRGRGGSNHHTEKDGEKIKTSQYNEERQQSWASQESVMSKEEDECNNSVSSNSTGFGKRGGKSDWRGWQKRGRGGSNHHTEKDGEKIKTSQYNEVRQQCWASQESVMSKEEDECNNSVSSNSTGFGKRGGKSDWRGWQKRGRGGSNHHTEKDGEKIKTSQYNEERQQSWASQESVMSKEEDECNNSVSSNSTGFGKRGGKSDWRGWQKRGRGGSNHHTEKDGEKIKTSQYNEERQQSWASQESVMSKEEDECNNSVSSNSTGFGKRGGKSDWRGWQKRGRGGSNHHTEKDGEKIKTSQYNEVRQQCWASQESVMSKEEDECNNSVSSNSTVFGKRGGKSNWRGWQRGRRGSNYNTQKDGEKIKTSQYNESSQEIVVMTEDQTMSAFNEKNLGKENVTNKKNDCTSQSNYQEADSLENITLSNDRGRGGGHMPLHANLNDNKIVNLYDADEVFSANGTLERTKYHSAFSVNTRRGQGYFRDRGRGGKKQSINENITQEEEYTDNTNQITDDKGRYRSGTRMYNKNYNCADRKGTVEKHESYEDDFEKKSSSKVNSITNGNIGNLELGQDVNSENKINFPKKKRKRRIRWKNKYKDNKEENSNYVNSELESQTTFHCDNVKESSLAMNKEIQTSQTASQNSAEKKANSDTSINADTDSLSSSVKIVSVTAPQVLVTTTVTPEVASASSTSKISLSHSTLASNYLGPNVTPKVMSTELSKVSVMSVSTSISISSQTSSASTSIQSQASLVSYSLQQYLSATATTSDSKNISRKSHVTSSHKKSPDTTVLSQSPPLASPVWSTTGVNNKDLMLASSQTIADYHLKRKVEINQSRLKIKAHTFDEDDYDRESFNVAPTMKRATSFNFSGSPIPLTRSKTQPSIGTKYYSKANVQHCSKLVFDINKNCKLVIKSYGNIVKEKSELLVCVLGSDVDMRKTKVGLSFHKEFPYLWEELKNCQKNNPYSKVLTVDQPLFFSGKAICHVILTPWDKERSPEQIETALQEIFKVVDDLDIQSVSIPPLGYGQAFGFPAECMVHSILTNIKLMNISKSLKKVVLFAPNVTLFEEYKDQAPKYFDKSSHYWVGSGDLAEYTTLYELPKQGTIANMEYLAKQKTVFPSYWCQSKTQEATSSSTWSSLRSFVSNMFNTLAEKNSSHARLVDVDSETKEAIKKLLIETHDPNVIGQGADAVGMYYSSLEVTDIKRVENPAQFEKYHARRKEILEKMIRKGFPCQDVGKITGSKGKVLTSTLLSGPLKDGLYTEINEHYLFHGTKPSALKNITENGFDPGCSKTLSMFGQAVYAAERFTKADQYSDDKTCRKPNGTELTLILARMLLGNVFVCDENHKWLEKKVGRKFKKPPCMHCLEDVCICFQNEHYDSVMGDGKWLFREFVVYDGSQCYPEYVIKYRRLP